jgi:hypothetical protein
MLPLALAHVPVEDENNWSWFLQQLVVALRLQDRTDLVIVSDRDKGLIPAVERNLPRALHTYCAWHISQNLRTRFRANQTLTATMFAAAKALRPVKFDTIMNRIVRSDQNVYQYLLAIPHEKWSRAHSRAPRYGEVTSNLAEVFNAAIDDILPVVPADRVVAADVGDSSSLCPPTMLTGDSGTTFMLVYFAIAINE